MSTYCARCGRVFETNTLAALSCCKGVRTMTKEEQIKQAEKEELEALRELHGTQHHPGSTPRREYHAAVDRAQAKLKALRSPLPSRDEMRKRDYNLVCSGDLNRDTVAEQHWADAYRFLADYLETQTIAPAVTVARGFANDLEARSK